jgi:phenylacetate-CoA ligase
MPLIRYRIGDLAALSDAPCECGRLLPVLTRLIGRNNELIRTSDGRLLVPEAVSRVMTGARASVLEYQIIQRTDASLDVRVVQRDGDADGYRDSIVADLDRLLGAPGLTRIERVDTIGVTPAGKLRHIISEMTAT